MILQRILAKFRAKPPQKLTPLLSQAESDRLRAAVKTTDLPVAPIKPKPKGRVIKQTRHSEFNPNPQRSGGRIVKVMPRELQKMKAAQEKVEDDEPSVEDLDNE